ncbi:MAG TPA: glutaredoxin family protein [Tepidisphaeraceae bacterium]|nr:glutaredoxin family protein [Tepidisphaeraceae bacterium]
MHTATITVFGADWCHDTRRTLRHLDDLAIESKYVNVEQDAAAMAWVEKQNDGKQKFPTVDVGGLVLSVPSDGELDAALRRQGFLSRKSEIDALGGQADLGAP